MLVARTGWNIAAPPLGVFGCVMLTAGIAGAIAAGWLLTGWLVAPILLLSWLATRLDGGSWGGAWSSLGSLARVVAAENHKLLASAGSRHSPTTVWHALIIYLEPYLLGRDDRRAIARETRLVA